MSFLSSLGRFFGSIFGLAEGKTERYTDELVSGNAEAIRNQFRKTKEDWIKDYNQMREAVAELIRIREMKADEAKKLNKTSDELEIKMNGAINLYKSNPDERYRAAYGQLASQNEQTENRIKELMTEIEEQNKQIERYKLKLIEFQKQIEDLGKEEAETVADIVSSQKIKELNDRLQGISNDAQVKNLEAIRSARQKAKSVAKLSAELSGADKNDLHRELAAAGTSEKFLNAFDSEVGKKPITASAIDIEALPVKTEHHSEFSNSKVPADAVDADIQKLLQGVQPIKK